MPSAGAIIPRRRPHNRGMIHAQPCPIRSPALQMFEIKPMDPQTYRQQTRRSTLIIVVLFVLLTMLLSTGAVSLLGQPGGDNFRYNLGGVIAGVLLTFALVRLQFWQQPWMAAAVYGWQLKRNLMRVTNVMHHVTSGVAANNPAAMKLLRFYHLGLLQMHQLDGNTSALSSLTREIDQHREHMEAQGLDLDQTRFDSAWLTSLKA